MDRVIELGRLLDYYGTLLTEHQYSLVDAYANENLSLSEIAERENISRQGVRDGIVRAEKQLREMEEKLSLIRKTDLLLKQLHTALNALDADRADGAREALCRAVDLLEDNDGI